MLKGWPHCRQSIRACLRTRFRTREMRFHLGSEVPDFQDANSDIETIFDYFVAIAEALSDPDSGVPGYRLRDIEVIASGARNGRFGFLLSASISRAATSAITRSTKTSRSTGSGRPHEPVFDHRPPTAVIIQELDYEAARARRIGEYVDRLRIAGIGYEVGSDPYDPVPIAAEAAASGDVHFVARLNDAARVTLLPSFAEGSDLDIQATRAGIVRFTGELDAALRERIRLAWEKQVGSRSG